MVFICELALNVALGMKCTQYYYGIPTGTIAVWGIHVLHILTIDYTFNAWFAPCFCLSLTYSVTYCVSVSLTYHLSVLGLGSLSLFFPCFCLYLTYSLPVSELGSQPLFCPIFLLLFDLPSLCFRAHLTVSVFPMFLFVFDLQCDLLCICLFDLPSLCFRARLTVLLRRIAMKGSHQRQTQTAQTTRTNVNNRSWTFTDAWDAIMATCPRVSHTTRAPTSVQQAT